MTKLWEYVPLADPKTEAKRFEALLKEIAAATPQLFPKKPTAATYKAFHASVPPRERVQTEWCSGCLRAFEGEFTVF